MIHSNATACHFHTITTNNTSCDCMKMSKHNSVCQITFARCICFAAQLLHLYTVSLTQCIPQQKRDALVVALYILLVRAIEAATSFLVHELNRLFFRRFDVYVSESVSDPHVDCERGSVSKAYIGFFPSHNKSSAQIMCKSHAGSQKFVCSHCNLGVSHSVPEIQCTSAFINSEFQVVKPFPAAILVFRVVRQINTFCNLIM